mmetsp:Transcript_23528/g.51018  ORF Transcript_23528/g.51018 Transcript_23528/m.51018 type:complete len:416 (+) Transcript_23528:197-1444(+)
MLPHTKSTRFLSNIAHLNKSATMSSCSSSSGYTDDDDDSAITSTNIVPGTIKTSGVTRTMSGVTPKPATAAAAEAARIGSTDPAFAAQCVPEGKEYASYASIDDFTFYTDDTLYQSDGSTASPRPGYSGMIHESGTRRSQLVPLPRDGGKRKGAELMPPPRPIPPGAILTGAAGATTTLASDVGEISSIGSGTTCDDVSRGMQQFLSLNFDRQDKRRKVTKGPAGVKILIMDPLKRGEPGYNDQQWNDMFGELRDYWERNNRKHCDVPYGWVQNLDLGRWVSYQRTLYKLYKAGRPSSMTPFKINKLESIGFKWRIMELQVPWETRFRELCEYKSDHGDCNVPYKWKGNEQLAWWVMRQRAYYRKLKSGKPSSMTAEQIRSLESLGFQWTRVPWYDRRSQIDRLHDHISLSRSII